MNRLLASTSSLHETAVSSRFSNRIRMWHISVFPAFSAEKGFTPETGERSRGMFYPEGLESVKLSHVDEQVEVH